MAWTGHITDETCARRASMSVYQADYLNILNDGDLTSLAAAQAACETGQALLSITDRNYAAHSERALAIGAGFGASVTGSSLATFYSSLPANGSHPQRMIA